MKISGLSNQWQSREGLFSSFVANLSAHSAPILHERSRAVFRLLESLESVDGPDLWVGTSHGLLNFTLRDTRHQFDRIPTFVNAQTRDTSENPPRCGYRVGFSLNGEDWDYTDFDAPLEPAGLIKRFLNSISE